MEESIKQIVAEQRKKKGEGEEEEEEKEEGIEEFLNKIGIDTVENSTSSPMSPLFKLKGGLMSKVMTHAHNLNHHDLKDKIYEKFKQYEEQSSMT